MNKNLTLSIDADLLDKVRVLAAMKRTSVNALVREHLSFLVTQEQENDEIAQGLLKLSNESAARMGAWRPDAGEQN